MPPQPKNQYRKNHLSPEAGDNSVPNQEDLEAAMKAENEVSTPKLTSFSAVIDEVMPQIHEQIALRVNCPIMISTKQI